MRAIKIVVHQLANTNKSIEKLLFFDGFLYAFGAISEDLKQYFGCQEWAVSLIISLACGFYLLSGN